MVAKTVWERAEQPMQVDQQMMEVVVRKYARLWMVKMMDKVGRGPEEETELPNIIVRMASQDMEMTRVIVDSWEVGVWLKEERPKYQGQWLAHRVGRRRTRWSKCTHICKAKVRLKDGIKRDGLLQLDMYNFTQHTENSGG